MPTALRPHRIVTPDEGWNQNLQRQVAIFFDQHKHKLYPEGRPFWCYVENPADPKHQKRSVGELIPIVEDMVLEDGSFVKGWTAPWVPEQKYFAMAMSMIQGNKFRWNYPRMMQDYKEASVRYYTRCVREAAARNWPAPKLYGVVSFQLRAICGERPKSPKVPEAALAEDTWLLGFETRVVNEQLKTILDEEKDQTGISFEEAGIEPIAVIPSPAQQVVSGLTPDDLAALADFRLFRAQQLVDAAKKAQETKGERRSHHKAKSVPQTVDEEAA